MITHTLTHTTAIMFTHLYFLPRVHGPGANASPARQRRNTGIVYAMYSPITEIDVTAFAPSTLSEAVRIGRTVENPASALAPVLFTANVSASSTMYPTTAE